MPPVLNEIRRLLKGFMALALIFISSPALHAQGMLGQPPAEEADPSRPFLKSTGQALLDFGLSPLRLELQDTIWLLPAAFATGVLINNDVSLYGSLSKGDARRDWLDHSMPAVSALGDGLLEFSAAAIMEKLGDARLRRCSATAMQGLVVAGLYSEIFKVAAWSNRPSQDDSSHRFWAFEQPTQGMPSGHSFSAFCAAEVYGAEYGRWWTYPLAGLVAYSRIYNQQHWPSDVFVGSLLGIAAGVQANRATEKGGPPAIQFGFSPSGSATMVAHVSY